MIADLIHKIAEMDQENGKYYPRSSLAGPMNREGIDTRCVRSMVYWAAGFEPTPFPGRSLLVFDDGNWHEELTKDWIRKSIYKLHSEQMKISVMGRRGHIDGIITDPAGKDFLFEHKAINHFTFEKIWKGEIPWDYIHQACDYFYGLQEVNPDLQEGIILFKNKNTAVYLELWLSYYRPIDQCTVEKMVRSTGEEVKINKIIEWPIIHESNLKFDTVHEYLEKKTFPKRPYDMNHWRCEYCRWGAICWEGYEQEFEALADSAIFEGEIIDLCKYYLETNMHLDLMEKEKEKLRNQIIRILEEKEVRKGSAGPYNISWQLRNKESIDQALLPPDILQAAKKKISYYTLTIRQRKEKPCKDSLKE